MPSILPKRIVRRIGSAFTHLVDHSNYELEGYLRVSRTGDRVLVTVMSDYDIIFGFNGCMYHAVNEILDSDLCEYKKKDVIHAIMSTLT